MKILPVTLFAISIIFTSPAAFSAEEEPAMKESIIEVFRVVPGKHEEFIRFVAKLDAIYESIGIAPRQLYVHSTGAEWDFLVIQPSSMTPDKAAEYKKALEKNNIPSGFDFFIEFRKLYTEHSDTITDGPITAAEFIESLEKSRSKRLGNK